ncbi:MAG: hypothetical protein ACRBM6_18700 [Geminicoccales bacterium]
MAHHRPPIDAKAAKKMLRAYVVIIPMASLIGGWCALLVVVWGAFPAAVDHMPVAFKAAAAAIAVGWLYWLIRTFSRLPSLIDDIVERGLALNQDRAEGNGGWLGGLKRRD